MRGVPAMWATGSDRSFLLDQLKAVEATMAAGTLVLFPRLEASFVEVTHLKPHFCKELL